MTTHEQFLKDVANHEMTIAIDFEEFKQLKFRSPKSSYLHFQITVWDYYLCITGDVGTFVFSCSEDMFDFFRKNAGHIEYIGSKSKNGNNYAQNDAVYEFDHDKYEQFLKEQIKEQNPSLDYELVNEVYDEMSFPDITCLQAMYSEFDGVDHVGGGETYGVRVIIDFDMFIHENFKRISPDFVWSVNAIVWSIQQYDQHMSKTQGDV